MTLGCMFYYGQSLYRRFKQLNLVQLYGENTARGEMVRKSFRANFALPLLPREIVRRAFHLIVQEVPQGLEEFFFFYFCRVYIGLTQRQKDRRATAFEPGTPIQSINDSTISSNTSDAIVSSVRSLITSDHRYTRPIPFAQHSPVPSSPTMPTNSTQSTMQSPGTPIWQEAIAQRPRYKIAFSNMHIQAESAMARTNNGLESMHLHFMRGLPHHPSLSDFIEAISEEIDKQLNAAHSARMFKHKSHKRYVIQDAVIMRKSNTATNNNEDDIRDLIVDLSLQVQGYAGKLREYANAQNDNFEDKDFVNNSP